MSTARIVPVIIRLGLDDDIADTSDAINIGYHVACDVAFGQSVPWLFFRSDRDALEICIKPRR